MSDNDITVITADFMYLVVIASHKKIKEIINNLNEQNRTKCRYVSTGIDHPCAGMKESLLHNIFNNNEDRCIKFGEGVERAQALTFAEGYNKSYHILLEVEDINGEYMVRFPKLNLEDETEPEKLISSWIKSKGITEVMEDLVIRPVNIVGTDNEILVFAARVQR